MVSDVWPLIGVDVSEYNNVSQSVLAGYIDETNDFYDAIFQTTLEFLVRN